MSARICFALFVLAGVFALPPAASAGEPVVAVREERVDLNIAERRIDRGPYEASLQVGIDSPLQVRVGVALSTAHITVTLRGVRGDGQFHGDLSRLTRAIAAHHVAP